MLVKLWLKRLVENILLNIMTTILSNISLSPKEKTL